MENLPKAVSYKRHIESKKEEKKRPKECRRQALVSWVLFEGALVASVTRWPLRGSEKYFKSKIFL